MSARRTVAARLKRARTLALLGAFVALRPRERSMLSTPEHLVRRPRYPAIDAHCHISDEFAIGWSEQPIAVLQAALDHSGIERVVDVSGGTGDRLKRELRRVAPLGDRVAVFAGLDLARTTQSDRFGAVMADDLRRSVDAGARGLKVWKTLGLQARDLGGRLVALDDERLDPLWATAGDLDVPIIIHVADPQAFFQRRIRSNERWEELLLHPEYHHWPPRPRGRPDHRGSPTHDELLGQFRNVLRRHPHVIFVGAHLAGSVENLAWVAETLDAFPNLYVDIAARLPELGRQPYSAHDFFVRFPDRILFATDHIDPQGYPIYYRVLETRDEYFEYSQARVPQHGRWRIYGLGLPDSVLAQVYRANALRIIWKST